LTHITVEHFSYNLSKRYLIEQKLRTFLEYKGKTSPKIVVKNGSAKGATCTPL